jgi:hypothetical protein
MALTLCILMVEGALFFSIVRSFSFSLSYTEHRKSSRPCIPITFTAVGLAHTPLVLSRRHIQSTNPSIHISHSSDASSLQEALQTNTQAAHKAQSIRSGVQAYSRTYARVGAHSDALSSSSSSWVQTLRAVVDALPLPIFLVPQPSTARSTLFSTITSSLLDFYLCLRSMSTFSLIVLAPHKLFSLYLQFAI